jgi:uncharacterized protein (UPF0276 family)
MAGDLHSTKTAGLGVGLGLRPPHYPRVLSSDPLPPAVSWFEVVSENYMGLEDLDSRGGRPLHILEKVRSRFPIVLHGVSLSIGSTDPLRRDYLERLKWLAHRVEPELLSDHVCWTGQGGRNLHDLLPLPYTEEAIRHIVSRVSEVQDILGRQFMLENVSSYLTYSHSEMKEWDFLAEISRRSGCALLLDVNNVYVSARNHGFDPMEYLRGIPRESVKQMHLAGHSDHGTHLIDTHDHPVTDAVWELYEQALGLFGQVATLIEWDDQIPSFDVLAEEAAKAEKVRSRYGSGGRGNHGNHDARAC